MKLKKMTIIYFVGLFLCTNFQLIAEESEENDKQIEQNTISLIPKFNSLNNQYQFDLLNRNIGQFNTNAIDKRGTENVSYKSPWLACGLAISFPGLGQIYNGEYGKLAIIYGTAIVGAGLGIIAIANSSWGTSKPEPSYVVPLFEVGLGLISVAWIYSIIDAPISANRINKKASENLTFLYKPLISNRNVTVNFKSEINKKNLSFGLSVNYSIPH